MASVPDQLDLKYALLSFQFGEPGDEFDRALEEARILIGSGFVPRNLGRVEPAPDHDPESDPFAL